MDEYYTWKQFCNLVLSMLTTDADRAGIESFRPAMVRQAVIKIQSLIPEFRVGHEIIYYPQDLVVEGHASRGVKPPQSTIRDVWLVRLNDDGRTCFRYTVEQWPWEERFALVNGRGPANGKALFSIDPKGYEFLMYPEVFDCWLISMFIDGQKLDFKDDELTPFTEMMAGAVADFLKAEIKREVDQDLALSASYMKSFSDKLPLMALDARELKFVQSTGGYGGGVSNCGGRTVCDTGIIRPDGRPCYTNPILIGDVDPTITDVPDKQVPWFWKNRVSGLGFTWDVKAQAWI